MSGTSSWKTIREKRVATIKLVSSARARLFWSS